jgi:O-antigen/teichoic acid export membrane protein
MPRVVDDQIGQAALGVWDFGWAFVSYFSLAMIGIGSSVNRYVARYRSANDTLALNKTMSTVVGLQFAIGIGVFLLTLVLAWSMPYLFQERLGDLSNDAIWVVGCLGSALAIQMVFDSWRGVMTGCHRWDLHSFLNAGSYVIASVVMLAVVLLGGGLKPMSITYLVVTALTELIRYRMSRNLCPEIRLDYKLVNRADAYKVVRFGLKTIILYLPTAINTQTINVLVVAYLGPAALAALARPQALIRHISSLATKYSHMLTPTAGSLQGQSKDGELHRFALQNARIGWLMAVPPFVYMIVFGDVIVDLWMGDGYIDWASCALLAVGSLLHVSQGPTLGVMIGLDAHGQIAKWSVLVSTLMLVIGIFVTSIYGWTLPRAAALIGLSTGIGLGGAAIYFSFKYLKLTFREYWSDVLSGSMSLLICIAVILGALRALTDLPAITTLAIAGFLTLLVTYILHKKEFTRLVRKVRG